MSAQHLPQCGVEHVRGRVIAGRVLPADGVHVRLHRVTQGHTPLDHRAEVNGDVGHDILGVSHLDPAVGTD